jgi:hypothetical protein
MTRQSYPGLRPPILSARAFAKERSHAGARVRGKIAHREAEMRQLIILGAMAREFHRALSATFCAPGCKPLRAAIRPLCPPNMGVGHLFKFRSFIDSRACALAPQALDSANLALRVAFSAPLTRREKTALVRMAGDEVLCELRRARNNANPRFGMRREKP